jgi:Protein of unknown function (DUF551)
MNKNSKLIEQVMEMRGLDFSYGRISKALQISVGTVSGIVHRNRKDVPNESHLSKPITVNGVNYKSQSEASRILGCHIRHSRKHPDKKNLWQPIETAPKDGTSILAFPCIFNTHESGPHVIDVVSFQDGRWYLSIDDGVCSYATKITHWMPLPIPPTD